MVIVKLVMVGDAAVGKTSYLMRIAGRGFSPTYLCTIGIDFYRDRRTFGQWSGAMGSPFCEHHSVALTSPLDVYTWDTAGQERFHSFSRTYFRGVHGAFVCFDITDRPSFQKVSQWIASVKYANVPTNVSMVLIGTKHDLRSKRKVSFDEAMAYATAHGMPYFETSAKTGVAIHASYEALVQAVLYSPSFVFQKRPSLTLQPSKCSHAQYKCPCG